MFDVTESLRAVWTLAGRLDHVCMSKSTELFSWLFVNKQLNRSIYWNDWWVYKAANKEMIKLDLTWSLQTV